MNSVKRSIVAVHMREPYASLMTKVVAPQQKAGQSPRTLIEWLRAEMAAQGLSQDDLIRRSGLRQDTVNKLVNGKMNVSTSLLPKLEIGLRVKAPGDLASTAVPGRRRGHTDGPLMGSLLTSPITGARPSRADRDVAVWLAIPVGRGPLFRLQTAATEFTWRPPALAPARNCFMLRMPDDSMVPWREADEPIYFDPDADPSKARHAMLQFDLGPPTDVCLICRLLAPPAIGKPANARIYRDGRKSTIPDAPVRRVIPALEWTDLLPP